MRRGIKSLREDSEPKPGDREKPTSGKKQMSQAKLHLILAVLVALPTGCRSTQQAEAPVGPHFRILTYNVNWAGPRPDLAAETIRQSGADIVCLQETTAEWEQFLRQALGGDYSLVRFRHSQSRYGGGLGFLSKLRGGEIAFIPSQTGWFDGWIMRFETAIGPLQVLNVHLRPPISDSGSWVRGYFSTGDDRVREMELFYSHRAPDLPTLVAGDFNARQNSSVVTWLERKGMTNALPQFDRYTPTWHWRRGLLSLHRRMDHIVYPPELQCSSARVIRAGASDHYPVEAVFTKAAPTQ